MQDSTTSGASSICPNANAGKRTAATLSSFLLGLLMVIGWPMAAHAEMQWTNSFLPGPWPTSAAACLQGEVEPRIAALRAANPSLQYRYRSLTVNEFLPDEESQCNYVIERRLGIAWVTQETGPRTHFQVGGIDPCPEGTVDDAGTCMPKNAGPCNCPSNGSNPIDSGTGNKYQRETDYMGAGTYPLLFQRHYNSLGRESGVLGLNWRHHFQRSIVVTALSGDNPTRVKAYRADGKRYDFNLVSGAWRPDADVSFRLQRLVTSGNPSGWSLTTAEDDVEVYDARGRLMSITLRSGQRHTLTYDSSNRLSGITDSEGRVLTLAYDGSNRIQTVTDPAGELITFGYDAGNRLTSVTYPDTTSRAYIYNEPPLTSGASFPWALTGIVDESATRFASFGYDTQGRAISSQHAGGANLVTISYSPGGVRTVTDALSAARTFTYSTVLGTRRSTGISQFCTGCGPEAAQSLSYDANGNVSSRTDFNGNVSTHTFDLTRNLETSRTEAFGTPVARTIVTSWHSTFRLPTQFDEPGRRTTFTYSSTGNMLTRTVTDLTVSPTVARTWTYTYDSLGRVLTEDGPRTDVSDVTTFTYHSCTTGNQCGRLSTVTNALGHVTTFSSYNAHGQPLTISDSNGLVTTLAYDARLRLISRTSGTEVTSFTYHPTGLLKRMTMPDGSFMAYAYDAAHRLTQVEDAEGNYVSYTRDPMGNATVEDVYDPSGLLTRTRSRAFNSLSRLVQQIGAAGTAAVTTTFGYDANGNPTSIGEPLARNTSHVYDELNRLEQTTNPGSGVTAIGYNSLDQVVSITDPLGNSTTYTPNAFGEVTLQVSPDSGTTSITYDLVGNLSTRTDARGKLETVSYDALYRPQQRVFADQTITYSYDGGVSQKGRLTALSDASGSTSWTYDTHGRVLSRQQNMGPVSKTTGYSYDPAGRLQSVTLPSGNVVTYGYDVNGRPSGIVLNGSATIVTDVIYEPMGPTRGWTWGNSTLAVRQYDADGKITDIDSAGLKSYSYDDAFRITGIVDAGDPSLSQSYAYDLLDRLASVTGASLNQSWTYDANGNRLSQGGSQPSTYTLASGSNRLASITGSLTRTYTHDAAGNVTSDGVSTFVYDDAGRMVSATRSGVTATYSINGLGQRVKKTLAGVSTHFVYDDSGRLLGEYDTAGNLIQETIWLEDVPVALLRPDGGSGIAVLYVHTDHLNAPRRISRPGDDVVVWRWDADPFGTTTAEEDPDGDGVAFTYNLRFPGQYFDAETGNHYNYFRDYDALTGRYVQSDPIGLAGGVNTFSYAEGAPTIATDFYGLTAAALPMSPPITLPSAPPVTVPSIRVPLPAWAGPASAVAGAGLVGWEVGSAIYPHIAIPLGDAIDSCVYAVRTRVRQGKLGRCLDACASKDASGGKTWHDFCEKTFKNAADRGRCRSHQFDSETACRGYCFNEFGS